MSRFTDQMGRTLEAPDQPQRIISLVPSQTELLYDLGLGDRVVGITRFCVHPTEWFHSKPRVGGTKTVDHEKVRALKPDLIIGNKEENERVDIEVLEREFPVWMSDVRDLRTAFDMILRVGKLTNTYEAADNLAHHISARFMSVIPLELGRSAAYLVWREPFMVAGGDTFISDMMSRCRLINAFSGWSERYARLSPAELQSADPDVVLLSSEPYPFKEKHIAELAELVPRARVLLVDGEMFSWYGSRMLLAADHLAGLVRLLEPGD